MLEVSSDKLIVGPWVAKKIFGSFNPHSSEAIGLMDGEAVRAGVIYEGFNGSSMMVHAAVEGRLTPYYLWAICHYPFVHAGVGKVIAPIGEGNTESVRFVEKFGFRLEAQILDAHPDGRLLLYTLRREDCRFLKSLGDRYGQGRRSTGSA